MADLKPQGLVGIYQAEPAPSPLTKPYSLTAKYDAAAGEGEQTTDLSQDYRIVWQENDKRFNALQRLIDLIPKLLSLLARCKVLTIQITRFLFQMGRSNAWRKAVM
jgi:hypothetical protein